MKHFIKRKENFKCESCGFDVVGGGYTNHCPRCLTSKHVDEELPGDRKSGCLGLMRPIGLDKKGEEYILIHKCEKCGKVSRNKVSKDDDFEAVVRVGELVR